MQILHNIIDNKLFQILLGASGIFISFISYSLY